MAKFSLDSTRKTVSEVQENLEEKKEKMESLKEGRNSVNEIYEMIKGLGLDEAIESSMIESINQQNREIDDKADALYKEVETDQKQLDNAFNEIDEETERTEQGKSDIESAKKFLESIGMGESLESSIQTAELHIGDLESLRNETANVEKKAVQLKNDIYSI